MLRIARRAPKDPIFHAHGRAVSRLPSFPNEADYHAVERVLAEAHERFPVEIMAYCVMPNDWHNVRRPTQDGQLIDFLRWLTHSHDASALALSHPGTGHLHQGRIKACPAEDDEHFYTGGDK